MSKTFLLTLAVIAVYVVVIFPKKFETKTDEKTENKADTESGTGLSENADKNEVSHGAAGKQKHRIGYTN